MKMVRGKYSQKRFVVSEEGVGKGEVSRGLLSMKMVRSIVSRRL